MGPITTAFFNPGGPKIARTEYFMTVPQIRSTIGPGKCFLLWLVAFHSILPQVQYLTTGMQQAIKLDVQTGLVLHWSIRAIGSTYYGLCND